MLFFGNRSTSPSFPLIIENKPSNFAIILEEYKDYETGEASGKVDKIKAGLYSSVAASEGCL